MTATRYALAAAALFVGFSGCLGEAAPKEAPFVTCPEGMTMINATGAPLECTLLPPQGVPEDFYTYYRLEQCEHYIVFLHPPLDNLRAYLPEGFEPLSSEEVYPLLLAGQTLPDLPLDSDTGVVNFMLHPCDWQEPADGPVSVAFNWIFIKPPAAGADLQPAPLDVYATDFYFDGPGQPIMVPFWDGHYRNLTTERSMVVPDAFGWRGEATTTMDGDLAASIDISNAVGPDEQISGYVHIWNVIDDGLWFMRSGYIDVHASLYVSMTPSCTMQPALMVTAITGVSSCAEAAEAGYFPTGVLGTNHPHSHGAEIIWDKDWDGEPIQVAELTPWQDHVAPW